MSAAEKLDASNIPRPIASWAGVDKNGWHCAWDLCALDLLGAYELVTDDYLAATSTRFTDRIKAFAAIDRFIARRGIAARKGP